MIDHGVSKSHYRLLYFETVVFTIGLSLYKELPYDSLIPYSLFPSDSCEIPTIMKINLQACIGILDNESEDDKNYSVEWKEKPCMKQSNDSSWNYHQSTTASRIVEYLLGLEMKSSGYVASLSLNCLEAKRRLNELKKQSWLDDYTRKIEVKSLLKILDTNSVIMVNMRVEFLPTGNKKQTHEIKTTRIEKDFLNDWLAILSFAILSIFSIIWILGFLKEAILQNISCLKQFKKLNTLAFALSMISILASSFARDKSLTRMKASKNTNTVYESFNEAVLCDIFITHFLSILGLSLTLYLLQLLMFVDSIRKAVGKMKKNICNTFSTAMFLLLGTIMISSFAHLKFCYEVSEFKTLREVLCVTLTMLIKGHTFRQLHPWTLSGLMITLSVIVIRYTAIACLIAASQTARRKVSHEKTTEKTTTMQSDESTDSQRKKDKYQTSVCLSRRTKVRNKCYNAAKITLQVDKNNSSFSNLKILDEQSTRQMSTLTEYLNEIYLDKVSWELYLIDMYSRLKNNVKQRKKSNTFGLFKAVPYAQPLCTIKMQKSQKTSKKKLKLKKRSRQIVSQSTTTRDENRLQLPRMHACAEEGTNDEARKAARSRLFSLGMSLGSLQAALARARRNNAQKMIKTKSEVLADEMMELFRARSRSHSHSDVEPPGDVERERSHEWRDFILDEVINKSQHQPVQADMIFTQNPSHTDAGVKDTSSNSETDKRHDRCEAMDIVHYSRQKKLKRKQRSPSKRESCSINIEFDAETMK